jgi:hypothetical protein
LKSIYKFNKNDKYYQIKLHHLSRSNDGEKKANTDMILLEKRVSKLLDSLISKNDIRLYSPAQLFLFSDMNKKGYYRIDYIRYFFMDKEDTILQTIKL